MKPLIVLFHPRTLHEKNYRYFYIPYSLLSVANNLDRSRYDVLLIDNNVERTDDWRSFLRKLPDAPACVGISSMIGAQIFDGLRFSHQVAEVFPGIPRIWGGALPTVLPRETANHPEVDLAVAGQGQETFRELVDALVSGASYAHIPAVHDSRRGGASVAPASFRDWSDFPPFQNVYDLVDVDAYIQADEHINSRTVNYHSSQGCPFGCGFCSEVALWNRKWTSVDPERIISDVAHLIENHSVNGIKFYDAEFFISRKRVLTFAQMLIDSGLKIRWAAAVHPRNLDRLSDSEIRLLAESGASRFLMGAESGVQDELNLVNKKTDQGMLLRIARRCADVGIVGCFSFVTGYPGSPSSHVESSLEFASRLLESSPNHEAKVHFYAPYPGTPMYPLALAHGFTPPDTLEKWADYDYYYITTPWVDLSWEKTVREFNEDAYPYLHGNIDTPKERICPIIA